MHVDPAVFYGVMRIFLSGYKTLISLHLPILVLHMLSESWFLLRSIYIGGKTTPVCQKVLFMRGSKQSQLSIRVGVLHRAACCTALMNFWAFGMKQAVVRQPFNLLKLFITTETDRCEKGLIVATLLLPRCFSNAHEELHAPCTQATDPGHILWAAR